MPRRVKCTKERCLQCKYRMNLTGAAMVKNGKSSALIACGYILKTGKSRVFENGHVSEKYKSGYCNKYESGERVDSLDSMTRKITLKKGRKKK